VSRRRTTLRQHPEVDRKDNLRAARLPLVFIPEGSAKTRKNGVIEELPPRRSVKWSTQEKFV
jgi:hypothetical protein